MKHKLSKATGAIMAVACLGAALGAPAAAGKKTAAMAAPALKVGDLAPDFKLQYFDGHALKDVSLQDYRGKKNVVVAFYVFAFTGG
jgi:cytochrome oxidase Cu insertion factor (SCO1/SenC/PrrC family)